MDIIQMIYDFDVECIRIRDMNGRQLYSGAAKDLPVYLQHYELQRLTVTPGINASVYISVPEIISFCHAKMRRGNHGTITDNTSESTAGL